MGSTHRFFLLCKLQTNNCQLLTVYCKPATAHCPLLTGHLRLEYLHIFPSVEFIEFGCAVGYTFLFLGQFL